MNVFITGGTGLLGYHLQLYAPPGLTISSCYSPREYPPSPSLPFPSFPLDITDLPRLTSHFANFPPHLVIHTAAQGSLDWCEANQASARAINTNASINLMNLCHHHHAHLIFISSNAVYDGRSSFSSEQDPPHPLNFYGASKLAVEQALLPHPVSSTILRPNLMYGWPYPGGRDNQVTRVISSLRQSSPLDVVADTWFSPVSARFVSRAIWHCALNKISGLYNIGGANRMTLFSLAKLTAAVFQLDASLLRPISVRATDGAPRALDTSFSTDKMQRQLSLMPESVQAGLRQMKSVPVPSRV